MGEGNEPGSHAEGLHCGNVYGTHLIGPLLVRNPHFMQYLITQIGTRLFGADWAYRPVSYPYEERAYEITLSELSKRLELQKA